MKKKPCTIQQFCQMATVVPSSSKKRTEPSANNCGCGQAAPLGWLRVSAATSFNSRGMASDTAQVGTFYIARYQEALRNIGAETYKPVIFMLASNERHNGIQAGLRS